MISQRQYFIGIGYDQTLTEQMSSATDFATDPVAAQGKEVEARATYIGGTNDGLTITTSFYTDGHFTELDIKSDTL